MDFEGFEFGVLAVELKKKCLVDVPKITAAMLFRLLQALESLWQLDE